MRLAHLRYSRFLDAFVDGELDDGLQSRVGDHAAVCSRCGWGVELTIHMKHSLARRRRSFPARAADRLREWTLRHGLS